MLEEIQQIKTKCEHPKAVRNPLMVEHLRKEVKLHQIDMEQQMHETLKSPKIQNYQYKPIFGFIFYLLSFVSLKKVQDQHISRQTRSRKSSIATSLSSKSPILQSRNYDSRRSTERCSGSLTNSQQVGQHSVASERSLGKNIANQILQTIERVFSSNRYRCSRRHD